MDLLKNLRKGSFKDLSSASLNAATREWPTDPACYELLEDCGRGVSATVHRALCKTNGEVVAVKKMNLDSVNMCLEDIIHEAQIMRSYLHPNVLPLFTSFVHGQELWMVTPFMSGGSVLHIMKYQHPDGLDEVAIATIMRYVLLGLEYVHKNNGIHRDVKAGNILIDRDGTVRIGDFGVTATCQREGSWGNDKAGRTTFVGTPCWMAPEVMEQVDKYNFSADIWSFGITMLELANGHAPFAKFPPMKVLLMTLQNPPPQLDDKQGHKHFSKNMRNLVARCLQKDPTLRPTATDLLQDKFFKQARDELHLRKFLLNDLPALGERVQQIRVGKAATNAAENDKQLERSQEEYVKGVSSWNFDLASLKAQAALEPDEPSLPTILECAEVADGDTSGQVSRRSTDDAAAQPVDAPHAGAAAAAAGATTLAAESQQQQAAAVQQPLQQANPPTPPQQQQQLQHQQAQQIGQPAADQQADQQGQQQQQQVQMRRAASAFAGSHALAAAAAAAGGTAAVVNSSSGVLQNHFSEPAGVQSGVSHGTALTQQHADKGLMSAAPAGSVSTLTAAGGSSGGSSYCLSPYNGSPPMSRESSSQGPLSAMVTPDGLPLKGKSKGRHGRFQVYEHGEEPPPMSPPANKGLQEGLTGSFSRGGEGRLSDSAAAETPRFRPVLAPSEAAELTAAAAAATAAAGTTGTVLPLPAAAAAASVGGVGVPAVSGSGTVGAVTPPTGGGGSTPPPLLPAALAAAAGLPPVGPLPGSAVASAGGGTAAGSTAAASLLPSSGGSLSAPLPPLAGQHQVLSSAGGAALGGSMACVAGAAAAAGALAADGGDSAAGGETKRRGRFKIIEEEGPSRGPVSKVPSSSDLRAGLPSWARSGGNAGVLSELLRLHEQSVSHSAALARLIEGVRTGSSNSVTNLVAVDEAAAVAAAGGAAGPTAVAAAAAAAGAAPSGAAAGSTVGSAAGGVPLRKVSMTGALSRSASNKGMTGWELTKLTLPLLLSEYNGDAYEVAERLLEKGQELERRLLEVQQEYTSFRMMQQAAAAAAASGQPSPLPCGPEGGGNAAAAALLSLGGGGQRGGSTFSELGVSDSSSSSRAASRRGSTTNYAGSVAGGSGGLPPTPGTAGGTGSGGGGSSGGLGERYSSGGNSADSAGGSGGMGRISSSSGLQEQPADAAVLAAAAAPVSQPAAAAAGHARIASPPPAATPALAAVQVPQVCDSLARDSLPGLARESVARQWMH